jgi:hypothetical protein
MGTTAEDSGYGVAVDASGYVYVVGSTVGGSLGSVDVFLVKYDDAGTRQWTRHLGTADHDECSGIAVDMGGNVYVTGITLGGLDGNTNAGRIDLFLVKYNAAGNWQWTRQLGTANSDLSTGVAVDAGGNLYVTGYTESGLDGNTNAGGDDMFLVKYDANGVKQ